MKRTALFATVAALVVAACNPSTSSQDTKDSVTVSLQQEQYSIGQPVPVFDWSLERDLVIQLYRARNERVATHTVWRGNMSAIEGDCPSIGFPVPYDTSLTNPLRGIEVRAAGSGVNPAVAIEQPEPNGVFASKNSIATWVMCAVETDQGVQTVPVYVEGKVTAYPMPVNVDYALNRVTFGKGEPSVVIQGRAK